MNPCAKARAHVENFLNYFAHYFPPPYVGRTTNISAKVLMLRIQNLQNPTQWQLSELHSPAEAIPGLTLMRGMVSKRIFD